MQSRLLPAPIAMTGNVAIFTPMPYTAINASQRIDVRSNGKRTQNTAREVMALSMACVRGKSCHWGLPSFKPMAILWMFKN